MSNFKVRNFEYDADQCEYDKKWYETEMGRLAQDLLLANNVFRDQKKAEKALKREKGTHCIMGSGLFHIWLGILHFQIL